MSNGRLVLMSQLYASAGDVPITRRGECSHPPVLIRQRPSCVAYRATYVTVPPDVCCRSIIPALASRSSAVCASLVEQSTTSHMSPAAKGVPRCCCKYANTFCADGPSCCAFAIVVLLSIAPAPAEYMPLYTRPLLRRVACITLCAMRRFTEEEQAAEVRYRGRRFCDALSAILPRCVVVSGGWICSKRIHHVLIDSQYMLKE